MRALTVVFVVNSVLMAEGADWPQVQRDPQRSGYTDDVASPPYKSAWSISFGTERIARCTSAIIAEGKVLVGTKQGVMHAVQLADGKELWSYKAGGPILHSAAAAAGKVFFACLDGKVYALDAASGKEAWVFDSGFGFSNAPLVAEGSLFVGNRKGKFFRLDMADGRTVWETSLGAPVFQTPAYNDGRVYIGSEDMFMHALSAKDGQQVWKSQKLQGQTFKDYWPVVHKGYVIVRPMVGMMDVRVMGFGPLQWTADPAFVEEATQAYPQGKPLPESIRKAQDDLVQWFTENPSYMETYFLKESDGNLGFVSPLVRICALGGPVPPPSVMQNGLLAIPLMFGTARWGAFDALRERIVDIWPAQQGNGDETLITTSSGPIVHIVHFSGAIGFSGAFDTRTRRCTPLPAREFKSPFWDNLVNGVSPVVISGNTLVSIACSTVQAWRGRGEQP